jgi:hypothetical protein
LGNYGQIERSVQPVTRFAVVRRHVSEDGTGGEICEIGEFRDRQSAWHMAELLCASVPAGAVIVSDPQHGAATDGLHS